jgi:transposase
MSMLAELVGLASGVDTHKDTHTAAVVDARTGGVLARATVPGPRPAAGAKSDPVDAERAARDALARGRRATLDRRPAGRADAADRPARRHRGRHRRRAAAAGAGRHRAVLAGAAPIPASSGKTVRYRLNRSGDRQLNRVLHTVALSRLRYDPRDYADRRRKDGKTDREIKRCLKRYIARALYRCLEAAPSPA